MSTVVARLADAVYGPNESLELAGVLAAVMV
jgi:hypothetical protein